jgi:hypothetical protein
MLLPQINSLEKEAVTIKPFFYIFFNMQKPCFISPFFMANEYHCALLLIEIILHNDIHDLVDVHL